MMLFNKKIMEKIQEDDKPNGYKVILGISIFTLTVLLGFVITDLTDNIIINSREQTWNQQFKCGLYGGEGMSENEKIKKDKDFINRVEEEHKYYALTKEHKWIDGEGNITYKHWKYYVQDGRVFLSNRFSTHDGYLTKMSKEEWNKLGINNSNADFMKVEE